MRGCTKRRREGKGGGVREGREGQGQKQGGAAEGEDIQHSNPYSFYVFTLKIVFLNLSVHW